MLKQLARDRSRNRRQGQKPQEHPLILPLLKRQILVPAAGFREADDLSPQCRADNLKPCAPEIDKHREQGSEMQRNVEGELVSRRQFVPAQESPHYDEVS